MDRTRTRFAQRTRGRWRGGACTCGEHRGSAGRCFRGASGRGSGRRRQRGGAHGRANTPADHHHVAAQTAESVRWAWGAAGKSNGSPLGRTPHPAEPAEAKREGMWGGTGPVTAPSQRARAGGGIQMACARKAARSAGRLPRQRLHPCPSPTHTRAHPRGLAHTRPGMAYTCLKERAPCGRQGRPAGRLRCRS